MSATGNLSLTVNSLAATAVSFSTPNVLDAPLAAGTQICGILVLPSGWNGTLALGGANAASFAIAPGSSGYAGYLEVGASVLASGPYAVTVTATP